MKMVGLKSVLAAGAVMGIALTAVPATAELSAEQGATVRTVVSSAESDQGVIDGLRDLLSQDVYREKVKDVAVAATVARPDLSVAIGTLIFRMYPDQAEEVFKIIAEVAADPNALAAAMSQELDNSSDAPGGGSLSGIPESIERAPAPAPPEVEEPPQS